MSALWHNDEPGVHKAWDATVLTDLRTCPRRYELLRVGGYYPLPIDGEPAENVHTRFGHEIHAMVGDYDRAIWEGTEADEAASRALLSLVERAWQWGGYVLDLWHCVGVEQHKTRRSFLCDGARDWWVGEPDACPRCGRPVERRRSYVPEHPAKNTRSLVRALVAYEEALAQLPWRLASHNDAPALGVKLSAPMGHFSPLNQFTVVGELDALAIEEKSGALFVREIKTTSRTPNEEYWAPYATRFQLLKYAWLAQQNRIHVQGVILQVFHITAAKVEVYTRILSFTPELLREAIQEAQADVSALLACTPSRRWPRNTAACAHANGGQACQFIAVCAAPPADREDILALRYGRGALWNPATASHVEVEEE